MPGPTKVRGVGASIAVALIIVAGIATQVVEFPSTDRSPGVGLSEREEHPTVRLQVWYDLRDSGKLEYERVVAYVNDVEWHLGMPYVETEGRYKGWRTQMVSVKPPKKIRNAGVWMKVLPERIMGACQIWVGITQVDEDKNPHVVTCLFGAQSGKVHIPPPVR